MDISESIQRKVSFGSEAYQKIMQKLSMVVGGSMYQTIYAGSLTTTSKEKIESLQTEYAIDLRKYANR